MTNFIQDVLLEIEGISILMQQKRTDAVMKALSNLPEEEIVAYRDSLADEFKVLNPSKHLLLSQQKGGKQFPFYFFVIPYIYSMETVAIVLTWEEFETMLSAIRAMKNMVDSDALDALYIKLSTQYKGS